MKLSYSLVALAAPILAAAAPGGTPTTSTVTVTVTTTATATPESQCAASAVQCCTSTTTTSDPVTSLLFGLLNIVIEGLNVPIGINCSPTSIIGGGATNWFVLYLYSYTPQVFFAQYYLLFDLILVWYSHV